MAAAIPRSKPRARPLGDEVEVLRVKASGADMAAIEPDGMPAVRLVRCVSCARRSDRATRNWSRIERANLIDPAAPNPSVEIMLHAFLPHKFVDHTHATAVLSIIDQPDGEKICAEVFGGRLAFVPYLMPGFGLARKAIEVFEHAKPSDGLILSKHGIVTFGESAREAYERMIEMVSLAEKFIARNTQTSRLDHAPRRNRQLSSVAPIVRGACSLKDENTEGAWRRLVLEFRATHGRLESPRSRRLAPFERGRRGDAGPHHPHQELAARLAARRGKQTGRFRRRGAKSRGSFRRRTIATILPATTNAPAAASGNSIPCPASSWCPASACSASAAPSRMRSSPPTSPTEWMTVLGAAESIGRFESITEAEMFDCEYWPLEQAKLGARKEPPLAGQIAAVTGAAGAIGAATARAFAAAGAEVALLDVDLAAAAAQAAAIGPTALAVQCDVTDAASVQAAFDHVVTHFGGVDIVVSNAGAAWQGRIGEVDEEILRKSFELNFYGHQRVAQAAVKIMLAQRTGGCLLFNVSKQAVNPGPNFGPYGIPKAALLALMRQYALDYGADGIRANAVNADRIRSGLLTGEMIASRAKARGLSETELHERQSARPRSNGRRRGAGLPASGAGAQDHRRRHDRRWRQHRRGDAVRISARGYCAA